MVVGHGLLGELAGFDLGWEVREYGGKLWKRTHGLAVDDAGHLEGKRLLHLCESSL
jgi:hypothetical protein